MKKKKTIKINALISVLSILFCFVVIEWSLSVYQVIDNQSDGDFVDALSVEVKLCPTMLQLIEETGGRSRFFSDGGFRNQDYGENFDGFDEVIYDTRCLKSFSDTKEMRRVAPFPNNTYAINSLGYRGRDWSTAKWGDEINVFLLGGSTAFSLFANEENSIHSQLEHFLNNASENKVYNVYSGAAPGVGSSHEYRVLTREVVNYHPDIIIFLTGWNNANGVSRKYYYDKKSSLLVLLGKLLVFAKDNLYLNHISGILLNSIDGPFLSDEVTKVENFLGGVKDSKAFCLKEQIRCIFALQPTLLVPQKALSQSEDIIKNNWFFADVRTHASSFAPSYDLFDKFLGDLGVEYLDLTGTGSGGLYTGKLSSDKSVALGQAFKSISVQSSNTSKDAASVFTIGDNDFRMKENCSENTVKIVNTGRVIHRCSLDNPLDLMAFLTNESKSVGHRDVVFNGKTNDFIFSFTDFVSLNTLLFGFEISNYNDGNDINVTASLSKDGRHFFSPQSQTKGYQNGVFEFEWGDFNAYSGDLTLKLSFRNNSFMGLKTLDYIADETISTGQIFNGKQHIITNNSYQDIFVETAPLGEALEIFVDVVHLTHVGNRLIAERISEVIKEGDF